MPSAPVPHVDVAIIGGGPAGAAAAMRLARGGARVVVFEKAAFGRDKVCGDGLTPRAVEALNVLDIPLDASHYIDGLRMIANKTRRELPWAGGSLFPYHGAVWRRTGLDAALMQAADDAGADMRYETEALPTIVDGKVVGITVDDAPVLTADLTIIATGAPGAVARMLGANRIDGEPFGLAIRAYVESPRHADKHIEACLTLKDDHGTPVPGYGWMFPCGDGTVNIGAGALSTMKGFKKLNLNALLDNYRNLVPDWEIGEYIDRPRAWRLPMSVQKRHGPGWLAIGDAAGFVNPMNGEGIDYGLESGTVAADCFLSQPASVTTDYDRIVGERFDAFLRTGRRFSFLIGHPFILSNGLRLAVGTDAIAKLTLQVMGNLIDSDTPGTASRVLKVADKTLALADPLLRRTRAAAS
ncbi:MAG: geranylgeranyl reductase family protein [Acidimicrobiales bacterium]